jgi:hypothetical protein
MFRNVSGGSVFAVVKYASNSNNQACFAAMRSGSNTQSRFTISKVVANFYSVFGRRLDSEDTTLLLSLQSNVGAFVVHTGIVDYANSDAFLYINGTLDNSTTSFATDGNTSDTNSNNIRLGRVGTTNASYLNGDLAELIVYNRALTLAELTKVNAYLLAKWGVLYA